MLEEATAVARVAGPARLLDLEKQRVAVAIGEPPQDALRIAAALAFEPQLAARTAPIVHEAGLDRLGKRLAIHPRDHHDAPVACSLNDSRHETLFIEFDKIQIHKVSDIS